MVPVCLARVAASVLSGEGTDFTREGVRVAMQELIDAEAATAFGAGRYDVHRIPFAERTG